MSFEQSWIASLSPQQLHELRASLTDVEAAAFAYDWPRWARPKQLAPAGDWDGWLLIAGRGFGKTKTACEFVRQEVEAGRATRIALIAETSADGRDVIVEGDSGLLAISPPWNKPLYEPSKRRVTWENGAVATLYDAREPDQLRGPQHDLAVLDELAKYRYGQAVFDQMLFGLRLGIKPRWVAATTPRPTALIRGLMKDPRVAVTRGSSVENMRNLAPSYQRNVIDRYAGTRLGRQELDAEILDDVPGALWSRRNLDEYRVTRVPEFERIVVGIDPAITSGDSSNETGIIVVGRAGDGHGYVLDDFTVRGTPDAWGRAAIAAYRRYEADRLVAEVNQGGDMVEHVLRSISDDAPLSKVRATRGKYVRAEPISALYEQGRIHHWGTHAALEDQMVTFTPETASDRSDGLSPDRVDALVWACTDLFPQIVSYREERPVTDDRSVWGRDPHTGY